MDLLNILRTEPMKVVKVAGVALIGIIVLVFAAQLLSSTFRTFTVGSDDMMEMSPSAPGFGYGGGSAANVAYDSDGYYPDEESKVMLSARNAATSLPYPPQAPSPSGDMAEAFEITQYSAYIETRKLDETCNAFDELKKRDDVIFESAHAHDRGCSYIFKVKHASVEEVLEWLRAFDPKELSENSYTIKQQIDDFTNEVEVLEKKRTSIDETLEKALTAYDEITDLATRTQNADALAEIINSKIMLIERLTQERININEQLDRLSRAKDDQLDRLEYTYFTAEVVEDKFVDGERIADSWKQAVQQFFHDVNKIAQDLSINLILLLMMLVQWIIYAVIVLFVAKYGWKFAKNVWNR